MAGTPADLLPGESEGTEPDSRLLCTEPADERCGSGATRARVRSERPSSPSAAGRAASRLLAAQIVNTSEVRASGKAGEVRRDPTIDRRGCDRPGTGPNGRAVGPAACRLGAVLLKGIRCCLSVDAEVLTDLGVGPALSPKCQSLLQVLAGEGRFWLRAWGDATGAESSADSFVVHTVLLGEGCCGGAGLVLGDDLVPAFLRQAMLDLFGRGRRAPGRTRGRAFSQEAAHAGPNRKVPMLSQLARHHEPRPGEIPGGVRRVSS